MRSALRCAAVLATLGTTLVAVSAQDASKYAVKPATTAPPKELNESVRKLLTGKSVQFHGPDGGLVAELWFRKEVPAEATPEQVKNGVSYREVPQTTILGAVRFDKGWSDYRQQKVKAGVYTIRLGFQPQDGDHMGTAPFPEFGVLIAAAKDTSAGPMEVKKMQEQSAASIGTSHPAVCLLYPNDKPGAAPQLVTKPGDQVVLDTRAEVSVGGKATGGALGIGLTLVGHAD
jgi:hypothetical protein